MSWFCLLWCVFVWCFCSTWVSLEVSVRLRVVFVFRMCCRAFCSFWLMAFARFIVCVSAVFESDIIMLGCPGGIISCASMIAMSSVVFMHVFVVPIVCGMACMRVSRGVVGSVCQSYFVVWFCIAMMVAAAAALCLMCLWGLCFLYEPSVAMIRGELCVRSMECIV